jgi:hypothetical protein
MIDFKTLHKVSAGLGVDKIFPALIERIRAPVNDFYLT